MCGQLAGSSQSAKPSTYGYTAPVALPSGEQLSEALMHKPFSRGESHQQWLGASGDGQIHVLQKRPYTPSGQLPSPPRAAPRLPGGCPGRGGERGQSWQVGVASCSHSQFLPSLGSFTHVGQQGLATPLGQVGRSPRGTGQKQPQDRQVLGEMH